MLSQGDKIPEFSLKNQAGELVHSKDLLSEGNWLCIYFYPADGTPGCTTQGCQFRDLNAELAEAGCTVVGISSDSVESHKKFHTNQKFNFDILSDPDHKLALQFGSWGEKNLYGKITVGMKRMTFLINPQGEIAKVWKRARARTNAQEVLDVLDTLKSLNASEKTE